MLFCFFAKSCIFYYDNVGPPYYFYAVCEKPILEGEELPDDSPDNTVCCDNCALWFHFIVCKSAALKKCKSGPARLALEDLMTENLNVIATD